MIVIKGSGVADAKAVRRLARALSAESTDVSVEETAPPPQTARKSPKPTVSTLAGASVAPATQAAISELKQAGFLPGAAYETADAD